MDSNQNYSDYRNGAQYHNSSSNAASPPLTQIGSYAYHSTYRHTLQWETQMIHLPPAQNTQDWGSRFPPSYAYGPISSSYTYGSYYYGSGTQEGISPHLQRQEYPTGHNTTASYTAGRGLHVWIENPKATSKTLEKYIIKIIDEGRKSFVCGWYGGCNQRKEFFREVDLIAHIKSVHVSEKLFVCTTCNAFFATKQAASHHVDTMNSENCSNETRE